MHNDKRPMTPSDFRKFDWWLAGSAAFLTGLGLLMMGSLGGSSATPLFWFWRQTLWVAVGILAMIVAASIDYRIFRHHAALVLFIYSVANAFLVLVLFAGTRVRGAKAWLEFGNIAFQPIEIAKLALILALAKYFATKNTELWRFRHIAISGVYTAIPVLLAALQPDLGSALVLVAIWLGMTILSGIRLRQLLFLIVILLFSGALVWNRVLNERQRGRVLAVINPRAVSETALYSARQALIAIGSGGIWGKGIGKGTQTQLGFLSEAKTDFVFAAISEELGILGMTLTLIALGIFLWRIMHTALIAGNNFARLLCAGFFIMSSAHIFVNIGMNLGIVPVIGIPLPFLSYGGSYMLANFIGIGIVFGIQSRSRETWWKIRTSEL